MAANILRKVGFFVILLITLAVVLGTSEVSIFMPPMAQATFIEEAWGKAGSVAYLAAANTMKNRNGIEQELDNFQKRYLRRYFIDSIDRVSITYGAQMMDRWVISGSAIRLGSVESAAQTYCDRIYIREPYKPEDLGQLIMIAHEMVHVKQCHQLGSLEKFGYQYFKEYKRANQVYEKNKLEKEAYNFQKLFANIL